MLILACALPSPAQGRRVVVKKAPKAELELEATTGSTKVASGQDVLVELALVNQSKRTQWVIQAGDGSEVGWREPHIWYSATRRLDDGTWEDVAPAKYARCGLYEPDWQNDAVALKPGARLKLATWASHPSASVDLSRPGVYRIVAHYDYRGGRSRGGGGDAPTGPLAEQKPFTLSSAPIEIAIGP